MDKQVQYERFLKGLRVALTNASIYFPEHPIFLKSAQEFRKKTYELFNIQRQFEMEFSYSLLSCNGEQLKPSALVEEMRNFFHRRKVKSVKVEIGVSVEDLTIFLQKASSPPKDILLNGGLQTILEEAKVSHINAEDLDYSRLLADQTSEYKYSWFYLLRKSLEDNDATKLQALADNFEKLLAQIDLSDPTDLNELKLVLGNFFNYLRKRHKEKFVNCLGSFIKLILEVPQDRSLDISKLQDIFSDLGAGDLAAVILSNLKGIKEFDSLNFELFSQLIRREDHEKVAVSLAKQLEREEWIKDHPEVMEKVKNLFSLPKDSYISEVYRRNLSSILSSISLAEGDSFDQEHLQRNYRLMLIDLLIFESEPKRLIGVMNKIFTELSDCLKKNNKDYVDKFIDVFKDKRAKAAGLESFFQELDERVSTFIEDAIFSKELNFDFSRLVSIIQSTSYGYQFYLDKIFKEPVPNKYAFKIFFKFFQREISHFCHQARVLNQQLKLAKEVIAHIKELESSLALELFKRIFSFSNDFVKLEILEAMQNLSYCDEGFLFPILKEKKVILRKKAFVVLAKHSQVRERLAEELLSLTNPFGIRTRLIRRNLDLVSTAPFLEAKKYLLELVQYKLFWNRTIRRQANIILGQYGR